MRFKETMLIKTGSIRYVSDKMLINKHLSGIGNYTVLQNNI